MKLDTIRWLKAMSAFSRSCPFPLSGVEEMDLSGNRHRGHSEMLQEKMPLCDGMRPLVAL